MLGKDEPDRLVSLRYAVADEIEVQRNEKVFQPEAARADVTVGRHSVEVNVAALVGKVLPVGGKRVRDTRVRVGIGLWHGIETAEPVQVASAILVGRDHLVGDRAGEWRAVRMDQYEVRASFALGVRDRPNPPTLVGQQFGVRIQDEVIEPPAKSTREFGRS